jgi:putative ABC transport system permease protein
MAFIDDLRLDARFALRSLRRHGGLTLTIVLTLALGVGATSAMFSILNPVLLRPLPYPDPDRLIMALSVTREGQPFATFAPDYEEWRAQCAVCSNVAAYAGTWPGNLSFAAEPQRVRIAHVTASLFNTMGVQPALGRTFLPEETGRSFLNGSDAPNRAIILSHDLWAQRFGSDRSIVGQRVMVDGDPCTVVGVMPSGFAFPDAADAWLPAPMTDRRNNAFLRVVARLKPGVSQEQAQSAFTTIASRLAQQYPETNRDLVVQLVPLHEFIAGKIRSSLYVFFGAVVLVLLIACANVANLLLAQAARRPLEIAVRAALGATRARLARQLLTESLIIAMLGAAAGLLLTAWIVPIVMAGAPREIPRVNPIGVDRWAIAFTVLLSMATGIVFSFAPIAHAARADIGTPLKAGTSGAARSARTRRLQRLLVAAEFSLALLLLIGAGLLVKSFVRLRDVPLGFNAHQTLTATVSLPDVTYPTADSVRRYFDVALEQLKQQPSTEIVGLSSALPLGVNGARIRGDFQVDGETTSRQGAWASKIVVGGDYFRALGIPLQRGRLFDSRDTERSAGVIIISESVARKFWPGRDPIGHRILIGFNGETWREIVGVVGDVRQEELGEAPAGAFYQPYAQVLDSRRWMIGDMTFVVRSSRQPEETARVLRAALYRVDSTVPVYDILTMDEVVAARTTDPRFYATLLGSFSLVALALAVAGLYGVVSYVVSQRTPEIGIRMALGARAGQIGGMIAREALGLVAIGAVLGLAGAALLTRVLTRFLYETTATDPLTFVLLPVVLLAAALAAAYFPARRATKVDPLVALRHE